MRTWRVRITGRWGSSNDKYRLEISSDSLMKLQSISEKRDIKRRFDVKFAISKEYYG
jgi:hypothetical protein